MGRTGSSRCAKSAATPSRRPSTAWSGREPGRAGPERAEPQPSGGPRARGGRHGDDRRSPRAGRDGLDHRLQRRELRTCRPCAEEAPGMMTGLPTMDVAARSARVREQLDVDALLVTKLVNVRYLTGFTGSAALLLVLPDELV